MEGISQEVVNRKLMMTMRDLRHRRQRGPCHHRQPVCVYRHAYMTHIIIQLLRDKDRLGFISFHSPWRALV